MNKAESIGAFGLVWYASRRSELGHALEPGQWLIVPLFTTVAAMLSALFMTFAFMAPKCNTAVCCCFFAANVLVTTSLSMVGLDPHMPSPQEFAGSGIVIAG